MKFTRVVTKLKGIFIAANFFNSLEIKFFVRENLLLDATFSENFKFIIVVALDLSRARKTNLFTSIER